MSKEVERIVNADRVEDLIAVFGSFDENVRRIEEALGVRIVSRGDDLKVTGQLYTCGNHIAFYVADNLYH